jgi:hypothetical protein
MSCHVLNDRHALDPAQLPFEEREGHIEQQSPTPLQDYLSSHNSSRFWQSAKAICDASGQDGKTCAEASGKANDVSVVHLAS